ncbi:hypothetical protein Hdeb2414_s0018g00521371 [Helianthus debilis subsp. tardiflorus]
MWSLLLKTGSWWFLDSVLEEDPLVLSFLLLKENLFSKDFTSLIETLLFISSAYVVLSSD